MQTVKKFQRISNLSFFGISADVHGLELAPEKSHNWKTSSHVLKNTPSGHYKTLKQACVHRLPYAYISNYFEILNAKIIFKTQLLT